MACPITWPPNTRCQLVFGLLPRNMFTSIGSRSRMEIRSIRPLDIGWRFRDYRSFRNGPEGPDPEVRACLTHLDLPGSRQDACPGTTASSLVSRHCFAHLISGSKYSLMT